MKATGLEAKKFEMVTDDGQNVITDDALDVARNYINDSGVFRHRDSLQIGDENPAK